MTASWVEVLVDCPGAKGLYTYRVPADWTVSAGNIVSVYFGRQQVGAIAIRNVTQLPEGLLPSQIKPIESIINTALFTKEYWLVLN
ncbi:MAG: primosomal protein N', partial [Cyanobacteria bacterium J06560_5]